jgi:hypothetical protein
MMNYHAHAVGNYRAWISPTLVFCVHTGLAVFDESLACPNGVAEHIDASMGCFCVLPRIRRDKLLCLWPGFKTISLASLSRSEAAEVARWQVVVPQPAIAVSHSMARAAACPECSYSIGNATLAAHRNRALMRTLASSACNRNTTLHKRLYSGYFAQYLRNNKL